MAQRVGRTIRVGIIGVGGWALSGPIPVLQFLDDFEIVAICSRTRRLADEYAARFGIPHAFDDPLALVTHPDVDLVMILSPAPEHARLVKAAIAAGRDVYSEWPLTTSTADSVELLSLAEAARVRHIVGVQRRFAPSVRYLRDLVAEGYVGTVRSARMSVSTDVFGPVRLKRHEWTVGRSTFSHVLSIYGGQQMDLLFGCVGFPEKLTAVVQNQFPVITFEDTGETVATTAPDEAMVIGTLEDGGLFSIQVEGAKRHGAGLEIDITGTEGVLKLTSPFGNRQDFAVDGATGDQLVLGALPVPAKYQLVPSPSLDASVEDLAQLFLAYARDRTDGTSEATDFRDAVKLHRILDQIEQTSDSFFERA